MRPPPGPAEQDASSGASAGPGRHAAVVVSRPSFGTHAWARENASRPVEVGCPLSQCLRVKGSTFREARVGCGAGGVQRGAGGKWQRRAGRGWLIPRALPAVGAGAAAAAGDSHRTPTEPSPRS